MLFMVDILLWSVLLFAFSRFPAPGRGTPKTGRLASLPGRPGPGPGSVLRPGEPGVDGDDGPAKFIFCRGEAAA